MNIKTIILILLVHQLQADEQFKLFIGSFGPKISQLKTREQYQFINNPNQYQDYQLVVNGYYGWDATFFPFIKINRFFLPWGMLSKTFLPYGNGYIKEITIENNIPKSSTCRKITSSLDITAYNIGNAIELVSTMNKDLYLLLGYNKQKITLDTTFELTNGTSNSTWQGFVGGIGLFLKSSGKLSAFVSGWILPDTINIQTSADNLLETPGYQSYRLMEYKLNGILYYQADSNSHIGLGGSIYYDHNAGKATIILSETKKALLTNPQFMYLKSVGINVSFVLKYSF